MLFKDRNLNHRNLSDQRKNMEELAQAINDKGINPSALKNLLLDGSVIYDQEHKPTHGFCTYQNGGSGRITEKRICRCMHYYNDINVSSDLKDKCRVCDYPTKLTNSSKFEILDYEVPMKTVAEKVGGIDLFIRSKIDGKLYGVEVKPPYSKETFVRMIAEILTYSELLERKVRVKGNGKEEDFEPAICFFKHDSLALNSTKDSVQWKDYHKLLEDDSFKTIIGCVKVFYITVDGNLFDIHEME